MPHIALCFLYMDILISKISLVLFFKILNGQMFWSVLSRYQHCSSNGYKLSVFQKKLNNRTFVLLFSPVFLFLLNRKMIWTVPQKLWHKLNRELCNPLHAYLWQCLVVTYQCAYWWDMGWIVHLGRSWSWDTDLIPVKSGR